MAKEKTQPNPGEAATPRQATQSNSPIAPVAPPHEGGSYVVKESGEHELVEQTQPNNRIQGKE